MKLSTYNLYGRYAVPKIFDFWPNMLAPNSEVEVIHEKYPKNFKVPSSSLTSSDGPYGAQMILREAKMSQLSLRAQMGQFGAQMSQLRAQMGQLGAQRGQWGAQMDHVGVQIRQVGVVTHVGQLRAQMI